MKKLVLGTILALATAGASADEMRGYVGGAFGVGSFDTTTNNVYTKDSGDIDSNRFTFIGGVDVNENFAIETRSSLGTEEGPYDIAFNTIAVYAKPQAMISPEVKVYGLLGYAWTSADGNLIDDGYNGSFSYGAGAAYEVNNDIEVFVDYTKLFSDSDTIYINHIIDVDTDLYSVNFGANYKF